MITNVAKNNPVHLSSFSWAERTVAGGTEESLSTGSCAKHPQALSPLLLPATLGGTCGRRPPDRGGG